MGRPKGSKSVATIFEQAARELVTGNINGVSRRMSKLEFIAIQMANKAAAGDPKAVNTFLSWMTKTSEAEVSIDPISVSRRERRQDDGKAPKAIATAN